VRNFFNNIKKTYIIAEIGVNHNGSITNAKKLVRIAKKIGANAVKFQSFKASLLASNFTPKTKYQKKNTNPKENHYDMLKKLELSHNKQKEIFNFCKKIKIDFLSTPYDINSAKFLSRININIFKIASADIVDIFLHEFMAKSGKNVLISTGMSSLNEINKIMKIYKKHKNNNICLLHCVSSYPCSDYSLNLKAISLLKKKYKIPVGFSDHSKDFLASNIAIALGSVVIEKHLTLDKNQNGPDHKSSLNPLEFKNFINNIRRTEEILGTEKKEIQKEEEDMALVSRKSLFFKRNLKKNQIIKKSDIILLRPGSGISPFNINKILKKSLKINVKKSTMVNLNLLK
jgi:N,N'-diacetyllegionaminate synthase